MSKITFQQKEDNSVSPLPEHKKATAADWNEVKTVVNNNDDTLNTTRATANTNESDIADRMPVLTSEDAWEMQPSDDGHTLELGQEVFFSAINQSTEGATALEPKAFKLINANISNKNFFDCVLVKADQILSGTIFGINTVTADPNGGKTKITAIGRVNNVKTDQWSVNDLLYIGDTEGELTNIKPAVNSFFVGRVEVSHATIGMMFIYAMNSVKPDISVTSDDVDNTSSVVGSTVTDALETLGDQSGVGSVTGDGVDNTDPANPVMSFPTTTELGLENVDNTADVDKPVSTAQQTALDLRIAATKGLSEDTTHPSLSARTYETLTRAEYDAIVTKNPTQLYFTPKA